MAPIGVCFISSLSSKFELRVDVDKKITHFRFKFLEIGAQSGIMLSPMVGRGCGGLLGGNANLINTTPTKSPDGETYPKPGAKCGLVIAQLNSTHSASGG